MTRTPGRAAWISILTLILCAATHARGDEPKTYRWVGEDGRVYTTTTPPPNGRGAIESKPAAPAKKAPAAKPDSVMAPAGSLRRFLQEAAGAEEESRAPASPAPDANASPCARYQGWIDSWRSADRSVESAREYLDRLQSDTDRYTRRNDSYYERQVESAEERITSAEQYLSQVERDATTAGTPSNCLTQ